MEEAFCGWHCHQHGDFACAAAFPKYGYIAGIAAKTGNVVAHPFKAQDDIQHARLSRRNVLWPPCLAELEIAKDVQPVVYRNNHDISFAGEISTFGNGISA